MEGSGGRIGSRGLRGWRGGWKIYGEKIMKRGTVHSLRSFNGGRERITARWVGIVSNSANNDGEQWRDCS